MSNNSPHNDKNKFLFNLNNFDPVDEVIPEELEEEIEVEPPPPTFSEDEIDAARAIAHSNGLNDGKAEEKQSREQHVAETLDSIAENFSSVFANETYRERQYEEESIKLSLEILNQTAPILQNLLGEEALKDILKTELLKQSNQSEIIIEVSPESANDIGNYIATIWRDKDKAPQYRVLANSNIALGACNIEWTDGGMIRDPIKTATKIKETLESLLKDTLPNPSENEVSAEKPDETLKIDASLDDNDENPQDAS